MTDYRHVSGFKLQGMILQQMLQAVDSDLIKTNLNDTTGAAHQFASNKDFVINLLIECINSLFPNLNKVQIEAFVWNLFNHSYDWH